MHRYGTSIAQGKSASVPSSAYITQLNLANYPHLEILNFGFSSNGHMDLSVMDYLNSIPDVTAFVIDCLPNMSAELVTNNTVPLVQSIRSTHDPSVFLPVMLVESATYGQEWYDAALAKSNANKRAALASSYAELVAGGDAEMVYVKGDLLLGEGRPFSTYQVDGTHPNDLGMYQMFRFWNDFLPTVLSLNSQGIAHK